MVTSPGMDAVKILYSAKRMCNVAIAKLRDGHQFRDGHVYIKSGSAAHHGWLERVLEKGETLCLVRQQRFRWLVSRLRGADLREQQSVI
ncbi:UNVERIFIED_CONTAM: hypothetical protein FKN15_054960 [Acipenser sinensis]